MLISAVHTWRRAGSISNQVSEELPFRVKVLLNQMTAGISNDVKLRSRLVEGIMLETKYEFERTLYKESDYNLVNGVALKERFSEILPREVYSDVDFYIISSEGVVSWTTYEVDLGLNLKQFPDFWEALNKELDRGIVLYPVTFEAMTGKGKTFAYTRLSNGDILEVGLTINPELYATQLSKINSLSIFLERVGIYNVSGKPAISGIDFLPEKLNWWEFYKRDISLTFYVAAFAEWKEPVTLFLRLNFFPIYSIFFVSIGSLFVLLVVFLLVAAGEVRVIGDEILKVEKSIVNMTAVSGQKSAKVKFRLKEAKDIVSTLEIIVPKMKEEEGRSRMLYENLKDTFFKFAEKLALIAEGYEHLTGEHLKRVKLLTEIIVNRLDLESIYAEKLINFSILHDLGKIYIPVETLAQPGPLDSDQWELMRRHPIFGAQLLGHEQFEIAREIALYHHENYDGSGYPFGLAGERIPLPGRIIKIVDVYDALRSERPYKKAFSHEEAIRTMIQGDEKTKPHHFDPVLIRIFLEEIEKSEIKGLYQL